MCCFFFTMIFCSLHLGSCGVFIQIISWVHVPIYVHLGSCFVSGALGV